MKITCLRSTLLYLFFISIAIFSAGCSKTPASTTTVLVPTVSTTNVIINLTATTAQSAGVILSNGGGTITTNGVCYSSTNTTPTVTDSKTSDPVSAAGTTYTAFSSNITGLTPNTKYYLRAYASNSAGAGYGGVLTFTTSSNTTTTIATVSTFAGSGTAGFLDGVGTGAQFNNPQGLTFDAAGNLYVADSFNDEVRQVTSTGTTSTIAGNQTIGLVNGAALSAEFYAPSSQAFDSQGNLYVSDFGNNVIRKITPAGVVSTYAGTGIAGYRNGAKDSTNLKSTTDSLAYFNNPRGLAVDASGNVFVADQGNNVIREIMTNGRTKTIAGNKVKGFIDATDAAAFFNEPSGVAVAADGTLYVTDQGNSSFRKITSGGVVTTVCGNPTQTTLFNAPSAITIDSKGNVYFVDEGGRVYEYTTASVLNIIAGTFNSPGYTNGIGSSAQFNNPQGIAVDASGNIFVADQYNNVIREITFSIGNINVARKTPVTLVHK